MTSGIYLLFVNKWFYVGSSVNLTNRKSSHLSLLKKDKHPNIILQRSFNKNNNFKFTILFETVPGCTLKAEQPFIDRWRKNGKCANIALDARAASRGRKLSEDHKRKIGLASKGRKVPHIKKAFEAIDWRKQKEAAGKHRVEQSMEVEVTEAGGSILTFKNFRDCALYYNLNPKTVSNYCCGKNAQPTNPRKYKHIKGFIFSYRRKGACFA